MSFVDDAQLEMFVADFKGKSIAAAMSIFYGAEAVYHYAGLSSQYLNIPAAHSIIWQAILEAKIRGKKCFNFWGIAPKEKKDHRFAGVTLFKTGFGGRRVDWLPAHDYIVSPLYFKTLIVEEIRRRLRGL